METFICEHPGCNELASWGVRGEPVEGALNKLCREHWREIRESDPLGAVKFSPVALHPGGILTSYTVVHSDRLREETSVARDVDDDESQKLPASPASFVE